MPLVDQRVEGAEVGRWRGRRKGIVDGRRRRNRKGERGRRSEIIFGNFGT